MVVWLGNGWYNCHATSTWTLDTAPWRDWPKLLCDIVVGDQVIAASDESWRWHESPITFDSLLNGEKYDARKEIAGFADPFSTIAIGRMPSMPCRRAVFPSWRMLSPAKSDGAMRLLRSARSVEMNIRLISARISPAGANWRSVEIRVMSCSLLTRKEFEITAR